MVKPTSERRRANVDPATLDRHERWLRGYFTVHPGASKGAVRTTGVLQKNVDYLRLKDVAIHLLELAPGKQVLDLGCADGALMIYCGLQGATVSGVDLDPARVASANAQMRRYGCLGEAVCGDANALPFPDDTFDAVIAGDFLEHVTDAEKVVILREASRVLKPGARVVIKTPNLSYLQASIRWKQLRALLKLESPFGFVIAHTPGTEDPQHIGLVSRWGLRDCLLDAGFLNYAMVYAPLRRFGRSKVVEVLSTEVPVVRDYLCEDLFVVAYKPVVMSHFPG